MYNHRYQVDLYIDIYISWKSNSPLAEPGQHLRSTCILSDMFAWRLALFVFPA